LSRFPFRSLCCIGVLIAAGCSGSTGGTDAGTHVDAGSPVDSGTPVDAGNPADGGSTDAGNTCMPQVLGLTSYPSGTLGAIDCDPMVPTECGFPFPSNVYLVDNPATPTKKSVKFGATTLPMAGGNPIDQTAWNDSDGFSPGQAPMTDLPGATVSGLPGQDTIALSVTTDSPTILLDTSTDPPSLVPHFAELDVSTMTKTDQAFMIRPAVRLKDATRYIVAIRHVVDSAGKALTPNPVFKALRDGTTSADPTVASRAALYADIMKRLKAACIDTSDLQIAWDYTTASKQNNTSQLVSMRDQALAAVGANGPTYTIVAHDDFTVAQDPYIARRIQGTVHVPLFLDHGAVTNDPNPMMPDLMTGYALQRDGNGSPQINTTTAFADFEFVVQIPRSAIATGAAKAPILLQGHGLFSDRTEGQDPMSSGYNYLLKLGNEKNYVSISMDLIGWRTPGNLSNFPASDSNPENDQYKAGGFVSYPANYFRGMIDRGTQGIINQLVGMRMMKTSFANEALVKYKAGVPDVTGTSVIDTTQAYYRGDSQGGILGITFMALSQDATRGYLGEPGAPYNLLLMRSVDFGSFLQILQGNYGSAENTQIVLGLMQMFWDRLEGDGFSPYITGTNLLPNTPSHNVLIGDAIGDYQVTPLGSQIVARTVGAVNLTPVNREIYGVPDMEGPYMGNGIVEFDFGLGSNSEITIPKTDLPPSCSGKDCTGATQYDPHDQVRIISVVYDQTDTFLRTGNATNPCGGKCIFKEQ
jgi:hypothetical protein